MNAHPNKRNLNNLPPLLPNATRHNLSPESELRIEVPIGVTCTVTLRSSCSGAYGGASGSAELFGAEITPERPLHFTGTKVAIFTWHGCTLDVVNEEKLDILYVSEETDANVAYVNTHAQLEAMRDEALASLLPNPQKVLAEALSDSPNGSPCSSETIEGPRVLLAGPADCGKSSLARVLTSYAVKLGRTPLLVDLDASQNMLSVPGTLAAVPMSADGVSAQCNCNSSLMAGSGAGATMPLVLWYGSVDLTALPDLYMSQLDKLGAIVEGRLARDVDARASGIIVNTSGWIEDIGYNYLLRSIDAFRINVVLILGHDRLYSMLGTHLRKKAQVSKVHSVTSLEGFDSQQTPQPTNIPKLIKLPRSGGIVSRDAAFRRASRSQSIKVYFYGDVIPPKPIDSSAMNSSGLIAPQYQLTPSLIEIPLSRLRLHKLSNISLSASMLPVSSKQSTDPIQLVSIPTSEINSKFQHAVLAVCHPGAVGRYEQSGQARDLYLTGVAGFVVVEKVSVEKEMMSVLSPCAGSLPSEFMLVGDIAWVE